MNRNLAVGLFVLGGLALFTSGLILVGNRHEAFQKNFILYTGFTDLSGLAKGSKVQVGGMNAGRIEEIDIPDSPRAKFRVKFRIDEKFHGLIRSDSSAAITTEGIVGDTFLSIAPGSTASAAASPGSTLGSKEPVELADLISQARGSLSDVDTAVKDADRLMTSVSGDLGPTLATAHRTLADVDDIVVGLKHGDGTAGMLLQDPTLAASVRQTITNTDQATHSLHTTAELAYKLLKDVDSRNFPKKLDDTLASVQDAASNLDSTSVRVRQTVAELTEPDEHGITAGDNLRETISNANTATGNLTEDTEALKHNFLARGFFRKRGYYTLTNISPAVYRRDPFFSRASNQRTWLATDQLFDQNSKGEEELSSAGKQVIEQALGKYGNAMQDEPIVVEGYSKDESIVNKIHLSRTRAVLVRNYICEQFHLDSMSIGIVALEDQTPRGADRKTWDGVSIVFLSNRR